jgi:hypothetical protein
LRVAQKIIHFAGRVRYVDGHEHGTDAEAGNVKQHRIHGLVHLDRYTIPRNDAPRRQSGSETVGQVRKLPITQFTPLRGAKKRAVRLVLRSVVEPIDGIYQGRYLPHS